MGDSYHSYYLENAKYFAESFRDHSQPILQKRSQPNGTFGKVFKLIFVKRRIFSMLCNMRSKLIPTDHIYIHKYRNVLSFDMFLNSQMHFKSLFTV